MILFFANQGKVDEARSILEKIYPAEEVDEEMQALKSSVEEEKALEGPDGDRDIISKLKQAWNNPIVRRGLYAGITVQVAQQFVGINTVMYYSPTIIQFAGFASNQTALALSLITSGLNAVGSIVSMAFVDRYGRRRLMIISMFGIISCLVVLSIVFFQASATSPRISNDESIRFGGNSTCSSYVQARDSSSWDCMNCLQKDTNCAFCSNGANRVSLSALPFSLPFPFPSLSLTSDTVAINFLMQNFLFNLLLYISLLLVLAWLQMMT